MVCFFFSTTGIEIHSINILKISNELLGLSLSIVYMLSFSVWVLFFSRDFTAITVLQGLFRAWSTLDPLCSSNPSGSSISASNPKKEFFPHRWVCIAILKNTPKKSVLPFGAGISEQKKLSSINGCICPNNRNGCHYALLIVIANIKATKGNAFKSSVLHPALCLIVIH